MSKIQEQQAFIEKVKREFKYKFNFSLDIWIRKVELPHLDEKFTVEKLEQIIVDRYNTKYFSKHESFKPRLRISNYVLYKSIFIKLASEYFKGPTDLGKYLDINHATIIHHIKRVNNYIDANDEKILKLLDEIVEDIHFHNKILNDSKNEELVPDTEYAQDNP